MTQMSPNSVNSNIFSTQHEKIRLCKTSYVLSCFYVQDIFVYFHEENNPRDFAGEDQLAAH